MMSAILTTQWAYLIAVAALAPLSTLVLWAGLPKHFRRWLPLWGCAMAGVALLAGSVPFAQILFHGPAEPLLLQADWFALAAHRFTLSLYIDPLTITLYSVVALVSLLVNIFSLRYLAGDPQMGRYYGYLGLFTFSMLALVLCGNLIGIYVFWELVGLSSYLLIGFWQHKPAARKAAKKAFLVNRIGDAGFLAGIALTFALFGELELTQLSAANMASVALQHPVLCFLAGLGLFAGAVGKSAQFPLSVWLPDAMEGPTPVSALIHAATMVAAGVYLLARVFFLLTPDVLMVIVGIGSLTAFLGALAALPQTDIKRVLAYSTISQLGFMVAGIGAGAVQASLFHLLTHAMFKAGLFLAAGAVIHGMHAWAHQQPTHTDPQHMAHMGGLRHQSPLLFATFTLFALSLAGMPLTAGFLSKDALLEGLLAYGLHHGHLFSWLPWFLLLGSTFLTACYITRQWGLVFMGTFRGGQLGTTGTSHWAMRAPFAVPLVALAALSSFFAFSPHPFQPGSAWWLQWHATAYYSEPATALTAMFTALGASLAGGLAGWVLYTRPAWAGRLWPAGGSVSRTAKHFFYLDWLYTYLVEGIAKVGGKWLAHFDQLVVDGLVNLLGLTHVVVCKALRWADSHLVDGAVKGLVNLTWKSGGLIGSIQGGKVQSYLAWAVFLCLCLLIYLVR